MGGFRNSILAGVTLVREAIQSQNYEAAVSGWTINADGTAEFADLTIRSSDGSGATAEIVNGTATFTAANGWKIIIDPTNVLPIIYFRDASGDEMGAINASGVEDLAALVLSSGPFADGPVTDWRWAVTMGETSGGSRFGVSRLRDEDESRVLGGWIFLDPDVAQFGVADSDDSSNNTLFQAGGHIFVMDGGRLVVGPPPGTQPGIFLNIEDAGHTGDLLQLRREGTARFRVDANGNVPVAGNITASGTVTGSNIRAGVVSTPAPGVGGGTSTASVVFPGGPMSAVPAVTICPRTTADPATVTITGYTEVTATGFTLRAYRSTNSATSWSYIAIAP